MTSPTPAPGPSYLVAGRYRLIRRIGHGGMGAVWLAHDQLLDREVAVKQVLTTSGMDHSQAETSRARALREGRLAARLSHRNAVSMHDVALDRDEPWLVMEYVPSNSVADILRDNGTISPIEAAQICAQVADAISDAHAAGIIHRDIKPANILIATTGRNVGLVKITDFGISRAKGDATITQTGVVTGTPAYFSPEVARGEEPGEASDVYSLGSTLYTMVEGTPPFGNEENYMATLHRASLGQINPIVRAGALSSILLQLLEPNPANRPTMAQARDLLAEFAASTLGSTDTVLTGLVPTAPMSAQRASETLPPPDAGTSYPSRPAVERTAVSTPSGPRYPTSGSGEHPSTRVASGVYHPSVSSLGSTPSYPAPTSLPGNYTPPPTAYQQRQQQGSNGNMSLAAAVFAVFVLLTAIAAGIIILAM
ncbi:serine/threonine-protein kinase [Gordonia phthalatica]|uniref:non-specific serine/threonine protein kinase n=1 Tax=Gordonia phthalatica TaxID=1136941 RepID=A0A0N9N9S1_9ACTN|nr:serine/threonine-protein kinase [Gordonia phthalatica]ALG84193.1 serine/threonine protein kinase [Gordonia phthalatica]